MQTDATRDSLSRIRSIDVADTQPSTARHTYTPAQPSPAALCAISRHQPTHGKECHCRQVNSLGSFCMGHVVAKGEIMGEIRNLPEKKMNIYICHVRHRRDVPRADVAVQRGRALEHLRTKPSGLNVSAAAPRKYVGPAGIGGRDARLHALLEGARRQLHIYPGRQSIFSHNTLRRCVH